MGEIAEDMLDGSCCSLCGQYFEHPQKDLETFRSVGIYVHEYPVACWACWTPGCGYEKAEVKTF
ncbi:MAG: hypothetical protein PHT07_15010 [Paludibacter sp.]|nr:hypothetical protein [Paludibacter sp.]